METLEFREKYIKKQKDLSRKCIRPPFPRIIKIDTCNICNYSCVFCPQSVQYHKTGCIDKELCYRLIKDAYEAGGRELCLSATGEPLMNPELEAYISYAKKIGYEYIFLNSNGYFLNKDRGKRLLNSGLDSIKISVNSAGKSYKQVHGVDAWDTVINNIVEFDKIRHREGYSCKLYLFYVAVKQTLPEVDEMKKVLGMYADEIIVMNANNRGGSVSGVIEDLYPGKDVYAFQYPCSQLFNNIYITAEGYMVVCCQDFENLTVVADLQKESITEAWNNNKFTKFRARYLAHDLKGTLCQNCIYGTQEEVVPMNPKVAFYEVSEQKRIDLENRVKELGGWT